MSSSYDVVSSSCAKDISQLQNKLNGLSVSLMPNDHCFRNIDDIKYDTMICTNKIQNYSFGQEKIQQGVNPKGNTESRSLTSFFSSSKTTCCKELFDLTTKTPYFA